MSCRLGHKYTTVFICKYTYVPNGTSYFRDISLSHPNITILRNPNLKFSYRVQRGGCHSLSKVKMTFKV